MSIQTTLVAALALCFCQASGGNHDSQGSASDRGQHMDLGAFSISLAVKDLTKSRAFYEKLGFEKVMGEAEQNWLILQNGASTIGLFQGMFEKNIMTFNPGWANDGDHPEQFTDVREIQRLLKARGLELNSEADESTTGPASLVVVDPDGNPMLIAQHVD